MKAVFDPAFGAATQPAPLLRSGYRRSRRQDPIATIGALALVVLLGSAFAYMSPLLVKKQAHTPVIVTLMELPKDPPPEQQVKPDLDKPMAPPQIQVVTPPSQVLLPPPPTAMVTPPAEIKPTPPAPQAPPPQAAAPTGPANGGELSTKVLAADPPQYPLESRRNHEQGTVILDVLVATDGRVGDISVSRSSGFARLDQAALNAVRRWRWTPLMRNGAAVMVRGVVTIPFVLQPGGRDGDRRGGRRHGRDHDRQDDGPGDDQGIA